MPKYITFHKDVQSFGGKIVYIILNKRTGKPLGDVFWYAPWKQWTARMDEDAVWSQDCLDDVRRFIIGLQTTVSNPSNRPDDRADAGD